MGGPILPNKSYPLGDWRGVRGRR